MKFKLNRKVVILGLFFVVGALHSENKAFGVIGAIQRSGSQTKPPVHYGDPKSVRAHASSQPVHSRRPSQSDGSQRSQTEPAPGAQSKAQAADVNVLTPQEQSLQNHMKGYMKENHPNNPKYDNFEYFNPKIGEVNKH